MGTTSSDEVRKCSMILPTVKMNGNWNGFGLIYKWSSHNRATIAKETIIRSNRERFFLSNFSSVNCMHYCWFNSKWITVISVSLSSTPTHIQLEAESALDDAAEILKSTTRDEQMLCHITSSKSCTCMKYLFLLSDLPGTTMFIWSAQERGSYSIIILLIAALEFCSYIYKSVENPPWNVMVRSKHATPCESYYVNGTGLQWKAAGKLVIKMVIFSIHYCDLLLHYNHSLISAVTGRSYLLT